MDFENTLKAERSAFQMRKSIFWTESSAKMYSENTLKGERSAFPMRKSIFWTESSAKMYSENTLKGERSAKKHYRNNALAGGSGQGVGFLISKAEASVLEMDFWIYQREASFAASDLSTVLARIAQVGVAVSFSQAASPIHKAKCGPPTYSKPHR